MVIFIQRKRFLFVEAGHISTGKMKMSVIYQPDQQLDRLEKPVVAAQKNFGKQRFSARVAFVIFDIILKIDEKSFFGLRWHQYQK